MYDVDTNDLSYWVWQYLSFILIPCSLCIIGRCCWFGNYVVFVPIFSWNTYWTVCWSCNWTSTTAESASIWCFEEWNLSFELSPYTPTDYWLSLSSWECSHIWFVRLYRQDFTTYAASRVQGLKQKLTFILFSAVVLTYCCIVPFFLWVLALVLSERVGYE